jgi:hypothetical protein
VPVRAKLARASAIGGSCLDVPMMASRVPPANGDDGVRQRERSVLALRPGRRGSRCGWAPGHMSTDVRAGRAPTDRRTGVLDGR